MGSSGLMDFCPAFLMLTRFLPHHNCSKNSLYSSTFSTNTCNAGLSSLDEGNEGMCHLRSLARRFPNLARYVELVCICACISWSKRSLLFFIFRNKSENSGHADTVKHHPRDTLLLHATVLPASVRNGCNQIHSANQSFYFILANACIQPSEDDPTTWPWGTLVRITGTRWCTAAVHDP